MEVLPLLSGTFDLFPLTEVLGLVERAAASGALVVRGREVDGTLYLAGGQFCGGEVADLSGPVADQQALEIRILEVCVSLLRSRQAEFEFQTEVTPPWPAALATPVGPMLERAAVIARDWPSIMSAVESFESMLERTGTISAASVTLSPIGFRVLELIDGQTTIRQLAQRAEASLIVVAPEVRSLILAGAVRVLVDPERALATAQAGAMGDQRRGLGAVLDVTESDLNPGSPGPRGPIAEPEIVRAPTPIPAAVAAAAVTVAPVEVAPPAHTPAPAPAPARVVETMHPASDPAEFARERAELASRAGLNGPGPVPESVVAPDAGTPPPERAQIVVDRSDLLRMFSGLKEE